MAKYEDGFEDGYKKAKEDLLEWADTFESVEDEVMALFYDKLIELLEQ